MEILLYDEGVDAELDIEEIARYLVQKIGKIKVEVRGNPFLNLTRDEITGYACKIARTKIQGANQKLQLPAEPLYGEIEYEKRRLLGKTRAFGILYDGFQLLRIFNEVLPREERCPEFVHIFFTNRLLATWDNNDRRYHLRTSLYAMPCLISTSGLVEAPAKPREYYLLKQQYEMMRKDLTELKDKFQGRFIDYEDERLTEVAKGYAMQAIFYSLTGDPFCQDKGCRLYNAHWQEELILAQLESQYQFCPRHTEFLEKGFSGYQRGTT